MISKWDHFLTTAATWWLDHGSRIILTLIAVWVAMRALRYLVTLMTRQFDERPEALRGNVKQARTVTVVIQNAGTVLIIFLGAVVIAAEMGFNPAALLASAGIIGVALGLGTQSLVKDVLAGCLILFEDQFGVGDVIRTGTHVGEVEMMSLRTTCLRDPEGAYIIIPNGELGRVTNYAKTWARAVIDIDIADSEDIDRCTEVLLDVAHTLAAEWPDRMIDKPEVLGVEKFSDLGLILRLVAKTAPLKQWEVARELRKRIKRALVTHRIAQPVPQRQIRIEGDPATAAVVTDRTP
ncbi:MAG: mechanosensitive ion channel family protein [Candidatus Sericytochromatia bacterium]|nr:mechanosensitive ion channel family protein [Candidatus Sericytochromatia bacterium]